MLGHTGGSRDEDSIIVLINIHALPSPSFYGEWEGMGTKMYEDLSDLEYMALKILSTLPNPDL